MGTIQFKQVNCKNCYKCIRNCPVKAISLIDDHAQVVEDGCVLCGKCLHICPQNAKSVKNEVEKVKGFIEKKQKVYASIAPSFPAAFDIMDYKRISSVFEKLGFVFVEETAIGASVVSDEYKKLFEKKEMKNIIGTACPTIVALVEKHFPQLIDQLAPVVSPMVAHGKMLKELYGPRIKVVFIGPCLSKKKEFLDSQNDKVIDAVITFDEFEDWMKEAGITFDSEQGAQQSGITTEQESNGSCSTSDSKVGADMNEDLYNLNSRFYPAPGGIIKSIGGFKKYKYKPLKFDGTERCMEVLSSLCEGNIKDYFIEMNSCTGGCLEGPCMNVNRPNYIETREKLLEYINKYKKGTQYVSDNHEDEIHMNDINLGNNVSSSNYENNLYVSKPHTNGNYSNNIHTREDFSKKFFDRSSNIESPEDGDILKVLSTIGKYSKEDELNCGACGYTTCREKAIAVIHGKAQIHMCLPYMKQRAESISNVIIHSTPNAIFALTEDLDIQEANQAACKIFNLESEDYKHKKIYEFIDCPDIDIVKATKTDIINSKIFYENYNLIVEQSILYINENHMIVIIMKDITNDEKHQIQMHKVKTETVEIAQKVIEKQMRVAQEIASLLGETTAETKVALTKLKNAIQSEMGDE